MPEPARVIRSRCFNRPTTIAVTALIVITCGSVFATNAPAADDTPWKKHVVHTGFMTQTAIAADFTRDGLPDIISNSGGKSRLFVAPDWKEIVLDDNPSHGCIHSEVLDYDHDGDLDYVAARYNPGLIICLLQPENPLTDPWPLHVIDDQVHGIHGLIIGDVNQDGHVDLLANSAQPKGNFPLSVVWYENPGSAGQSKQWQRHVFAANDAPGLSHYIGFGDVNGDGRPDASVGAKGGMLPSEGEGHWFAWWEAPADPTQTWTKHMVASHQTGATNIHPADVDGDGRADFIASRGHGQGVIWFEAPSWEEHPIFPDLVGPHCLVVTDMDDDGDIDAATCAKDDRLAVWMENDGQGNFTSHVIGRDQAAYDIRAYDMDRDGDLDIVIAGQASQNVVWYENPRK